MITQGVEYESHNIDIKPALKALYNEACDVWYEVSSFHKTNAVSVIPCHLQERLVGRGTLFLCHGSTSTLVVGQLKAVHGHADLADHSGVV